VLKLSRHGFARDRIGVQRALHRGADRPSGGDADEQMPASYAGWQPDVSIRDGLCLMAFQARMIRPPPNSISWVRCRVGCGINGKFASGVT
jgi:hypothetical protein